MTIQDHPRQMTGRQLARIGGVVAVALGAAVAGLQLASPASAQGEYWELPRAEYDPATDSTMEVAVLAGGCFWGIQALFQRTEGVETAISGYSGGTAATANYYTVGSGTTGHAEAVEIYYNPQEISYAEILRIFFSVGADPTTLNYQGPDHGPQYRSEIFYTTDEQREVAEAYLAQLEAADIWEDPIVTPVSPLDAFYPAEDYHQDYLINNPTSGYIVYWDLPKVANMMRLFPEYWRETPVTVAETRPELV